MTPKNLHSPWRLEVRCSLRRLLRRCRQEEDGGSVWRRQRLEEEAGGDEGGWRGVDGTAAADELISKQPLTCISTPPP